jgi:hypothetical protein
MSLKEHKISGISSMIRDLEVLSIFPDELESKILNFSDNTNLSLLLSSNLKLISVESCEACVGDIVLFKLKNPGAYPDMETLWGGRVSLEINKKYLGVLCERGSTKLITGEFQNKMKLRDNLELQLLAQAGGVGFATGFSPTLEKEYGYGQPSDVEILGLLYDDKQDKVLSTLELLNSPSSDCFSIDALAPTILVLGTATDVGKTTVASELIKEISQKYYCAAIKASGTGWYEDSLLHQKSGAFPILNFTFVGLPTTYYVDQDIYLNAMYKLFDYVANPENIPKKFIQPEMRDRVLQKPDIILVEHGGDLIWANIPTYLQDFKLMTPVKVILICSESALSLKGAIEEIHSMGINNGEYIKIFASVPLINPEGFYQRITKYLKSNLIEGVFDVKKPSLRNKKEKRCYYSSNYDNILSCSELLQQVYKHLFK